MLRIHLRTGENWYFGKGPSKIGKKKVKQIIPLVAYIEVSGIFAEKIRKFYPKLYTESFTSGWVYGDMAKKFLEHISK